MHRKLKLIVAMCQGRGIGNNNSIPWKIKKDLIYYMVNFQLIYDVIYGLKRA